MPTPPPLDSPEDAATLRRYSIAGLVFMAILIGAFPLYRAREPHRLAEAREDMRQENIELGHELYDQHCVACHGPGARGGRGSPTLAAQEFLGAVSDEQIHWLTAAGIPGTAMVAYDLDHGGPLTSQDIRRLVIYLRSLEPTVTSVPGWRSGELAPEPPKPEASAPVASARGGSQAPAAYRKHCASCHGAAGQGSPIAGRIRPPKAPKDEDLQALIDTITHGVAKTPMMPYGKEAGGPLDRATIEEIARWLQASP